MIRSVRGGPSRSTRRPSGAPAAGRLARARSWLGIELDEVSAREKVVSLAGGAVAMLVVLLVTEHALGLEGASMLIASAGASCVLLFGVPHGQLSQPWPLLGGHGISACIGVACAQHIGNRDVAAMCAVGLAIGAMHQLKCIHPPAGATALVAVIGGPAVTDLGWSFVLRPVLLNMAILVVVAVAWNSLFPWRRYPAGERAVPSPHVAPAEPPDPTHDEIVAALRTIDSFVDITEEDLRRLVALLRRPAPDR